jgi:hypothetical protein
MQGLGYTYADPAVARLINGTFAPATEAMDAMDPPAAWCAMQRAVRNLGRAAIAATAVPAVDRLDPPNVPVLPYTTAELGPLFDPGYPFAIARASARLNPARIGSMRRAVAISRPQAMMAATRSSAT